MTMFNNAAFKRGMDWAERRKQFKAQRAFTPKHLKLKEQLIEGGLTARRTATGPDDEHIGGLMTDWLLIREELDKEDA